MAPSLLVPASRFGVVQAMTPSTSAPLLEQNCYFWNDAAGRDSIVLGSVVSTGSSTNANAFFAVTEGASTQISFLGSQELDNAAYSNMFGVMSQYTGSFVSTSIATNMVTLSFGTTASLGFSSDFGSFVLHGTNVEGITSSFTNYGATQTGSWGGNATIPQFS